MDIRLKSNGLNIAFSVNDDGTVDLCDFSALNGSKCMERFMPGRDKKPRQFLCVQVTGESGGNAGKHDAGSLSDKWLYVSHDISENNQGELLTLSLKSPVGLYTKYYMQLYKNIPIVRTWATITNCSDEAIGIDYISSFMYEGIGKNGSSDTYDRIKLMVPRNGWANEAQWFTLDAIDAGLSHLPYRGFNLPDAGNSRFHYGSNDSWSSSEYLPICISLDEESGEVYYGQIDHSGAWTIEYGMAADRNMYICLLGPSNEADWWKSLAPQASFTTVPAAFGVALGGINEAFAALTQYRRVIRRPNEDDEKCFVVFNDYMNCLFGDPTEEKEKRIIDIAASLGCEYYCLDCGWYDAGPWWDKVGQWQESPERFSHGLKSVYDYCRQKGMRMGMWLEIEVMGVECPLASKLPDSWFICNHGRRRIVRNRYLLDFRNPEVRTYCTSTVDRLIADYGCEYFKIDYNVTTGMGSDLNADSRGDAMLEHCRAVYDWVRGIYAHHPNLVIENCCSGAMRMDYGMLSLHSLQSTSDQTDYVSNAYIASNVASAVTPEQGGMWVYPYEDEREHIIFNMVNGLLLRPYISGMVWNMSEESLSLMKEGIALYKKIRADVKCMLPFFPRGMNRVGDSVLAYGLRDEHHAYLSVFTVNGGSASVDLKCLDKCITNIRVIYPEDEGCTYALDGTVLSVTMPASTAARLFEIKLV